MIKPGSFLWRVLERMPYTRHWYARRLLSSLRAEMRSKPRAPRPGVRCGRCQKPLAVEYGLHPGPHRWLWVCRPGCGASYEYDAPADEHGLIFRQTRWPAQFSYSPDPDEAHPNQT